MWKNYIDNLAIPVVKKCIDWQTNVEIIFPSLCDICIKNNKVEFSPVVGFSLATKFNERVAMDIKEIKGSSVTSYRSCNSAIWSPDFKIKKVPPKKTVNAHRF